MILAADLYATDLMHLEINTFFAAIFAEELDQDLHFFAERAHLQALGNSVPVAAAYPFISWQRISRFRLLRVPVREFLTIFRVIRISLYARKHRPLFLHIFCASHLSHLLLRLVFKLLPPGCPILLTFHGELEALAQKRPRPWSAAFWLPLSLRMPVSNLSPVVLGESIRSEAAQRNYTTSDWITIEHPYDFLSREVVRGGPDRPFLAGCIGGANRHKGTHHLFALAESFSEEVARGQMRFRIIGKTDTALAADANEFVEIPPHHGFFTREQYDRAISELDVVLFFFPEGAYQLTASGSLFDAIRHNKPIIALENSYFRHIQRLVTGDAITLVNSFEEMRERLREWSVTGPPQQISAAYGDVRRIHDRNHVAEEFLRQLSTRIPIRRRVQHAADIVPGDAR